MSRQRLTRWIALAANGGVIVGLLLVVLQLRQNRELMRAQMRHDLAMGIVELLDVPAADSQLASVIRRGDVGEPLTADERFQFRLRSLAMLRYWEDVHYQYRQGLYDEVEFAYQKDAWAATITGSVGLAVLWCEVRTVFSRLFAAEVDGLLGDRPCDADARTASNAQECAGEQGLTYLCGPRAAEDLASLGSTGLILASGHRRPEDPTGRLYLIDPVAGTHSELIRSAGFRQRHDASAFPDCPGPLNLELFAVHGLSVAETTPRVFAIYSTSHGEREAIEVYELDLSDDSPALTWRGCVPLPADGYFNSVARLRDGGFVTTRMRDANAAPTPGAATPATTGMVFEWHPGGAVEPVPGTGLSMPNGIERSPDERYLYVAATASRELIRFDRNATPLEKVAVRLPIRPDNLRWSARGRLLTAGGNDTDPETCSGVFCEPGWSVLEIAVETMTVTRLGGADRTAALQGASAALQVGEEIWVGTYNGDRIARFARSGRAAGGRSDER